MLHCAAPAIALPDLKQFKVMAQAPGTGQIVEGGFEAMYSQTVDHALHGTGTETFEAIDLLRKADPAKYQPENGAQYPTSRLGQSLQQIGQLLKADIGVEVLFVDCGGWDNHVNGKWPGLNDHQLNEGRDLALTTDFRSVVGEILVRHIGVRDLNPVFPGFDNNSRKFLGLIKA